MARQAANGRPQRSEQRKEGILKGAERVFARKGFQEATISEVARESGVADATIYDYFASKEEILFTIPLKTTRKGKEKLEEYLTYIRSASDKLRAITHSYLDFYEKHPDYAAVALLILKQNPKFLETEAYRIIREASRTILRVVEEGAASGEFHPGADPYITRTMLLGSIEHTVISWLLLNRPSSPSSTAEALSEQIIHGLLRSRDQGDWRIEITFSSHGEERHCRISPEQGNSSPSNNS